MTGVVSVGNFFDFILEVIGNGVIIYAPSLIVFTCACSVAPPAVFHFIGMAVSEGIGESMGEPFVEPSAFFG